MWFMQFEKIKESDKTLIDEVLKKSDSTGSEYSMLYLQGWDFFDFDSMTIAFEEGYVFIRFSPHLLAQDEESDSHGYIFLPPLAPKGEFAKAVELLRQYCEQSGEEFYMSSCRKEDAESLDPTVYEIADKPDYRNYAEYLYNPSDLIELKGKKYHAKRNFISRFINTYGKNYVFRTYTADDLEGVCELFGEWVKTKSFDEYHDNSEKQEKKVVKLALEYSLKYDDFFADVMEVDGKIVGFETGELTASNVGIVHLEKGDTDYDGIYPSLCQMFAAKHFAGVRFINRQEDMGLEGLRKSKESYHPCGFVEKRIVRLVGANAREKAESKD